MDFNNELEKKKQLIENELDQFLTVKYPEKIYESINYSVKAGGKRVRPILLLAVCELFGGKIEKALPFACAIEMIHTYSLIHDDLPAMDNDDYRRGKLTNHKVFGEAIAILAGDGLLNKAYEIMAEECENNFEIKNIKAMNIIAKSAGMTGMVGGQTADIEFENKKADSRALLYIHENKTGKLIQAALVAGAIIGGIDSDRLDGGKTLETIAIIGKKIGLSFQIKDDILDVLSNFEKLGKNVNADELNNKTTYVSIYGMEQAQKDYRILCDEITSLTKSLQGKTNFLLAFENILMDREN